MSKHQSPSAIAFNLLPGKQPLAAQFASPLLILLAVWAALQVMTIATGLSPIREGLLLDTDSYMKLVRIEQLLTSGDWYDARIARSNSPIGETWPWTRLFDSLVILLAAPLLPFMDLRSALFWSGAAVSPLLMLMTAGAMIWAARPLLSESAQTERGLVAALTLTQPAIFGYAVAGRADHHVLFMLIFVSLFGAMMHALRAGEAGDRKAALRYAALAGGLAGLGVWASIELLVGAAACAAALGLAWLLRGGPWLRANLAYAAAFFGAIAVALVIERPLANIPAAESDRISILHLALSGGLVGVWLVIGRLGRNRLERPRARIALAAAVALAIFTVLALAFPQLLAGPLAEVDPRIVKIWMERVNEMRPLWPSTFADTPHLLRYLGLGVIALPFLIWSLIAEPHHPAWLCRVGLALGMVAAVPVALAFKRFAPFAELLFSLALCELLWRLFTRTERLRSVVIRVLTRAVAIAVLFVAPLTAAAFLESRPTAAGNESTGDCSSKAIAPLLADPRGEFGQRPLTILTSIDLGPELLYRTPHRVIATPNHRNANGIYDTYKALSGSADTARQIAYDRRVDLVLLCRAQGESDIYAGIAGAEGLYEQLQRGQPPDWLAPVTLPDTVSTRFLLFRVR